MSNDLKMKRSVSQAMYRYLPGRWVDFYIKKTRTSYTAFVEHWNSIPLEGVNVGRIKREVWRRLEAAEGDSIGFAPLNDANAWSVMTPKVNDANSAISAAISPLLFACSNPTCKLVRQFRSSAEYLRNHENNKTCPKCGWAMTQIRMIYYCPCGWAGPVEIRPCKNGCRSTFTRVSAYSVMCNRCGEVQEFEKTCEEPTCSMRLRPRNALDNAQFYPQSFHLIDLVDVAREQYVTANKNGAITALACYLGFLSKDKFEELIRTEALATNSQSREASIQRNIEILRQMMPNIPEDMLRQQAILFYEANNPLGEVENAIGKVDDYLSFATERDLQDAAVSYLEYDTIISVTEKRDLEQSATIAVKLEETASAEAYKKAAAMLHFSNVQACGRVPFVSAVYGYCRKSNEVGKVFNQGRVKVNAFARENGTRSNIYATKMETEGILFDIDRRAIMKWLIRNGIINASEYTESMDEVELKAWFLNHCTNTVPMYDEIDEVFAPVFKYVYGLLHSIAHALIKHAEAYTGLDKNSLSEYIFPGIPAIFIYCQNVQGFDLGAMFSAIESKLESWLRTASYEVKQCIFDPVCQNEKGACTGCMYLGDITCTHFNLDLDRRYLIGHIDPITGNRMFGFWEE